MFFSKIILISFLFPAVLSSLMATNALESGVQGQAPVIFSIDLAVQNVKEGKLSLKKNNLTGSIPEGLGNLDYLTSLDLSSNALTGTIPENVGNLTRLTFLNLWNNQLSGFIPKSLGNCTDLKTLVLANNNFSDFDGSTFTKDIEIYITDNPFDTFKLNPNIQYTLMENGGNCIHFDGALIQNEADWMKLHDILQPNVIGWLNEGPEAFRLSIGFYKGEDETNPHPISEYLQSLGVTHDTAIVKNVDQSIRVEGLREGFEPQPLIDLLQRVRDGESLFRFKNTKAARK